MKIISVTSTLKWCIEILYTKVNDSLLIISFSIVMSILFNFLVMIIVIEVSQGGCESTRSNAVWWLDHFDPITIKSKVYFMLKLPRFNTLNYSICY
ncbi:hypothetical protein EB796_000756 [Bugula neritina]|uniref:Uncharacterized protein n=1 Tax=Bugula neritina TaxID=10212 RepID=A0A7J7KS33_BUGNE|nr:hypothetical protein EB796_000756 [Bugula neritina]